MHKKKAAFHNLGCKVNLYETDAAARSLRDAGYEIVPFSESADVYVINTCSVTNIADRKSRQMIHRAKKLNPDAIVVAMGCYVQAEAEAAASCADIVIGNKNKGAIAELIRAYELNRKKTSIDELGNSREYESVACFGGQSHSRAFMKIQDGCDMFCSYCIIPYLRGRSRSRSLSDALEEAEALAQSGCKEIVLSGIHLSSYGKDLKDTDLAMLLEGLERVQGISRIRLGSLEPGIITEDFVKKLASMEKICPHFHLSLQSGSDKILKAMNRRYDTKTYREKCDILREYFMSPSITTDIIAGFPGESEEDFEESYRFVDSMSFFETHVFPFSPRKGTKAASMCGQLAESVKKERALRLIRLSAEKQQAHLLSMNGKKVEVLIEEKHEEDGKLIWTGHTKRYEKVAVATEKELKNMLLTLKVSGLLSSDCALGEPVF